MQLRLPENKKRLSRLRQRKTNSNVLTYLRDVFALILGSNKQMLNEHGAVDVFMLSNQLVSFCGAGRELLEPHFFNADLRYPFHLLG